MIVTLDPWRGGWFSYLVLSLSNMEITLYQSSNPEPLIFALHFSAIPVQVSMRNTTLNQTGGNHYGDILTEENWNILICLPLGLLYLVVMGSIYRTHRYTLEPIHIFELNILASAALLIINNSLYGFDPLFESDHYFCGIVHFFGVYNTFSFYIGIISSQVDRFLALYWNVSYKGRVTPELSSKIVLCEKFFLLIPVLVFAVTDPALLNCYPGPASLCRQRLRGLTSVWCRAVFWLMIATVLAVSLYVLYLKVKSSRQVQPTVNLPHQSPQFQQIETISASINEPGQHDIVLEDLEQSSQPDQQGGEEEEQQTASEAPEMTKAVQRQNPDPFMFYRIKSLKESNPTKIEKITCKWPFVDNTRRAMSFNLVSLCLLIMLMPTKVQEIYVQLSGSPCDGDSAARLSRVTNLTELIFAVIYPFIIKSKLHHLN